MTAHARVTVTRQDGAPCLTLFDDGMVLAPSPGERQETMALLAQALAIVAGSPQTVASQPAPIFGTQAPIEFTVRDAAAPVRIF